MASKKDKTPTTAVPDTSQTAAKPQDAAKGATSANDKAATGKAPAASTAAQASSTGKS